MITTCTIIEGANFKDRKTGLMVFGILEILLGGLCFSPFHAPVLFRSGPAGA
jgi:hypothetical protein